MSEELIAAIRHHQAALSSAVSEAAEQGEPVQVADLQNEPPSMINDIIMKAGYRARLLVPLNSLRSNHRRVRGAPHAAWRIPQEHD